MENTILNRTSRVGNFTSSSIGDLMTSGRAKGTLGAPALNYIAEKRMERRLGRSLGSDISARPTSWGNLVEGQAFEMLGSDYTLTSQQTTVHPDIPYWSGSADGIKLDTVFDIKSPYTLKSFCQLADCKTIEELRESHKEGDHYFWQLISNAILTDSKFAELIIYCPYKSELESIRELARNWDGENQGKFLWINYAADAELPYLIEGKHYKNLNIIRWEVLQADKDMLKERVLECGKLLINSQ